MSKIGRKVGLEGKELVRWEEMVGGEWNAVKVVEG
jgi:hypothetical protein